MLMPRYGNTLYLSHEMETDLGLCKKGLYLLDKQDNELFYISKTTELGRYVVEILGYREVQT